MRSRSRHMLPPSERSQIVLLALGTSPLKPSWSQSSCSPSLNNIEPSLSHMHCTNFDFVTQHCMNEEARQHSLNGMLNHGEMALAICAKDRSKVKCFNCGILAL